VSNPTSSKPGDVADDDNDDDDDEPAEDMDAFVESGRLEAEDNVIISDMFTVDLRSPYC